jgi:hypothetical protein
MRFDMGSRLRRDLRVDDSEPGSDGDVCGGSNWVASPISGFGPVSAENRICTENVHIDAFRYAPLLGGPISFGFRWYNVDMQSLFYKLSTSEIHTLGHPAESPEVKKFDMYTKYMKTHFHKFTQFT